MKISRKRAFYMDGPAVQRACGERSWHVEDHLEASVHGAE